MLDINIVMTELGKQRAIFHSEADFQHALAWEIHKQVPSALIRLERPFRLSREIKIRLDLLVIQDDRSIAIELKYKTRKPKEKILIQDEQFDLANHGAQDLGRYSYIKDIDRLEKIIRHLENGEGYAILLTNESSYWRPPQSAETADAHFRLTDDKVVDGTLEWNGEEKTLQGGVSKFEIKGKYKLQWQDYSTICSEQFRYLVTKVSSHSLDGAPQSAIIRAS